MARCGDIFCRAHCSKEVPLDQALDFNPKDGALSRACVGCFEAYEQWLGVIPSTIPTGRNDGDGINNQLSRDEHGSSTAGTTTTKKPSPSSSSTSSSRKLNTGRPDSDAYAICPTRLVVEHILIENRDAVEEEYYGGDTTTYNSYISNMNSATHVEHVKAAEQLNKLLHDRPAPEELVEKNILKDPKVAPALQQHAEELKKAQLEDTLTHKIESRPAPEELVQQHILHETSVAPGIQQQTEELKRAQLESTLNSKLEHRPTPEELVKKHIL
ncbi:hypothetical protein BGZ99_009685 [Dissophora globulifera]|uniref:Uncharacterized protein n=1 Tax=Dissophora globulifera TaxID=979702 RepID=A0A9P6UYN6_9FUNG|nr:hypothetical protein BGZ99_009685 [Dissophora globulifera]